MGRVLRGARPFLVLGLAGIAAAAAVAPAAGHDHRVPRAAVHVNEQVDRVHYWTSSWVFGDNGDECGTAHADGFPSYQPQFGVDHPHATPRIWFHKRQRPRAVHARSYSRLDDNGVPVGTGTRLHPRHLRPRREEGEIVAWIARVRVSVAPMSFIGFRARWRDEDGCGGSQGAEWSFSLTR
jgi:hypothetical protein